MKLYKYLFLVILTLFLFVFVQDLSSFSDGPPAGRTSAPGELNCSNGYCHNSFTLNSGTGEVSLQSDIFSKGYKAGQTYTVEAKVKHSGQKRFGFMVLAYDSISQISSGQIALSEPERTQLTPNQAGDRIYVTHDPATIAPDSSTWTFSWTAPETESGSKSVSFYAAFVAANHNNNSSGDYVYTTSFNATLDSTVSTPIHEEISEQEVKVLFDQGQKRISIESLQATGQQTQIEVLNLNAQQAFHSLGNMRPFQPILVETASWSSGIYILKIQQGLRSRVYKFRISD